MGKEIECKFLVKSLPEGMSGTTMRQGPTGKGASSPDQDSRERWLEKRCPYYQRDGRCQRYEPIRIRD